MPPVQRTTGLRGRYGLHTISGYRSSSYANQLARLDRPAYIGRGGLESAIPAPAEVASPSLKVVGWQARSN